MKAKIKTTQKHNNKKKLVGAVSMLTVSALMLSTATYAWFTMSRDVELKNIQMTATVPEDTQISLGALGTSNAGAASESDDVSLATNTGFLVRAGGSAADDGNVMAPQNTWDWSNTADISEYYQLGKIMPASSVNGANIYFTPNATGVGKTIDGSAVFYAATTGITPVTESDALGAGAGSNSLMTTLHAKTARDDTWLTGSAGTDYQNSTGWNNTNDDGYYVDIPVWLRTSSTEGAELTVAAYVVPRTLLSTTSGQTTTYSAPELYKAVRVNVIQTEKNGTNLQTNVNTNLLPVVDGLDSTSVASGTPKAISNPYTATAANKSVVDFYGRNTDGQVLATATTKAVQAAGTFSAANASTIYGAASEYNATNTKISLQAGEGTEYGAASKVIVRVWLEGEDPDCWNDNAGQDFSINLKFSNTTSTTTGG